MTFEDIEVADGDRILATDADVDRAEQALGLGFPSGYRRYVTTLGKGDLGGCYLRVYLPDRIVADLAAWRDRITQYWFWDAGADVLTKQRALECVVIADTWEGDELIVHPSDPETIYVLPRHDEKIFVAGRGLLDAAEWLFTSEALTEAFDERLFEPHPE